METKQKSSNLGTICVSDHSVLSLFLLLVLINIPIEPAYIPNPPDFEFRLQEETPSLSTTPRDISDSNSALSFSPDQSAPEPYMNCSDIVSNAGLSQSQGGRYHCLECHRPFKLKKDLRRHFETTKAHQPAIFQCCCAHTSGRKDNFLKHIEKKKPCNPTVPFICSCGYEVESNSPNAIILLLEHVKPCGQRKRGRPKK